MTLREALMRGCRFIRLPEWEPAEFAVLREELREGARFPIAQVDSKLFESTLLAGSRTDWEEVPCHTGTPEQRSVEDA